MSMGFDQRRLANWLFDLPMWVWRIMPTWLVVWIFKNAD